MCKIKIDREFQSLIPPLSQEEYKQLEANVIADGCRDALVTWQGTLIDGHNRFKICAEHNITYKTVEKDFLDRQSAIEWIILNQFGRRNLLPFQRSELALRLKPIIEAKAKDRQRLSDGRGQKGTLKSAEVNIGETRDELAKIAGVGHDTIEKVSVIQKKATPEQLERARKGGTGNTVNAIYREIKQEGVPTKVCTECGKTLPANEFYYGRGACKSCFNQRKTYKDVKGNRIASSPEADKLTAKYCDEIVKNLYDEEKEVEYTADDMAEELSSLSDYFSRNVKTCLAQHSTLLKGEENKQKIIAALSKAEAAIEKTKELLL